MKMTRRPPKGWLILIWIEILFWAYLIWWLKGWKLYDFNIF